MIFDDEIRRASMATETRKDPVKDALAAGDSACVPRGVSELTRELCPRMLQEGFLRTGAGSISLLAVCASEIASFVP